MRRAPQSHGVAEGGLGRLIETEARLAQALAATEAEAAALLDAAKAAAEAEAARFEEILDRETAEVAAEIAAGRNAEIRRVTATAEERCRRLEELPATVVEELAAWVTDRLLAGNDQGIRP
jgi:succinate dehydrogenase/fumarate reductase flavoprotein subunit